MTLQSRHVYFGLGDAAATALTSIVQVRQRPGATTVQGVIRSFDPVTGLGIVTCDTDLKDYELAPDALDGSILKTPRQGQRVIFALNDTGLATKLRLGSEVDMGTPAFEPDDQ